MPNCKICDVDLGPSISDICSWCVNNAWSIDPEHNEHNEPEEE